ncbi:alpha/beta fold hydrolase [Hymenobacter sp. H14-R3]|uniref:alpha/beta hydrolase family protein n=1 Tax=Hymenobacter sp. H14-R3 TaxID=3046308 RepID=UPI0024BAC638|nr:alpha/beta fold hydrolase [Hymenobacter sp. H14-R3]MDJ0365497.1 alpha/beta fold hydrolase [Hymenobacter sp. H14-R3]
MKQLNAIYTSGRRWVGTLLGLALAGGAQAQQAPPQLRGTWAGTVTSYGTPALVLVNFDALHQPGAGKATVALPSLGLHGVQVDRLTPEGDSINLVMSGLPGSYRARLTADTLGLAGYLLTAGQRLPLRLSPVAPARLAQLLPARAQAPRRPLPYRELPIAFAGGAAGVTLAGTVSAPPGLRGPAVVFISGSGPHNRDGEEFGHQSLLVPADALARQGFIVLRYDERGVGASTGRYATAGTADFARDAAAAVRALRTDPRLRVGKVYVVGHSQGALEAARVAAQDPTLAGVVLLGGIGQPLAGIYQARMQANFQGRLAAASPADRPGVEKYVTLHNRLITIAATLPDSAAALAQMQQEAPALGVSAEEATMYASSYLEPTTHDILAQDPTPYLRKMRMPVLALTGTLDAETPAATQLPALRAQLKLAGNPHVTTQEIPLVNHFFQTNAPGQEKSLFENPETFAPAELRLLSSWLTQQAGLVPRRGPRKTSRSRVAQAR